MLLILFHSIFGIIITLAICNDGLIVALMCDLVFVSQFCSWCHYNELLLRDCCSRLLKVMRVEFLLWSKAKVAWFLQDIFVFFSSLSRCVSEVLQVISCADEFQYGKLIRAHLAGLPTEPSFVYSFYHRSLTLGHGPSW